jgi:hypothetical protein
MEETVKSMDGDLKQADVPSCLASANSQLRKALGEMDAGMTGGITALRSQSYADAQQAISTLDQAAADAQQAQDALDNNSCNVSVV